MTHPVPTPPLAQTAWNRAVVWVFVCIISLPLLATLAGVEGADPLEEKRELAVAPSLSTLWRHPLAYLDAGGNWFEDHFAFRGHLVRWYAESQLYLLHQSPTASVVLGNAGWLFYGDDGGKEDFINERAMDADEVAAWRTTVLGTRDWLKARGIAYVFTIAPDKPVIYPEHFPSTARPLRAESRADQVFAALSTSGVAVDVRPVLQEAKARERLYHQTDTHWNDRGAFLAYQQLIDAVRAQDSTVPPAWRRQDFAAQDVVVEGQDLAGMLGLRRVMREDDMRLVPVRSRLARVVEPAGGRPDDEVGRVVTEIPGSQLPRAVVFRDSFASALAPFLSEHFSRAVYLWQNDFDADAVLAERANVVIQEIVGRHLYGFTPSPELLPR